MRKFGNPSMTCLRTEASVSKMLTQKSPHSSPQAMKLCLPHAFNHHKTRTMCGEDITICSCYVLHVMCDHGIHCSQLSTLRTTSALWCYDNLLYRCLYFHSCKKETIIENLHHHGNLNHVKYEVTKCDVTWTATALGHDGGSRTHTLPETCAFFN